MRVLDSLSTLVRVVVITSLLLSTTLAHAAPRKLIVLPLEGNADAKLRTKLSSQVQRLARVVDGEVTPGTTTMADTAIAVGCDPKTPACVESVRKTLGVDELIYGSANVDRGTVTIVVYRSGIPKTGPRQISTTILATDPAEKADAAILPLFTGGGTASTPDGGTTADPTCPYPCPTDAQPTEQPPVEPTPPPVVETPPLQQPLPMPVESSRDRKFGIAASVGGGALLLIGLALWSSKTSIQDDIDSHPTATLQDFQDLEDLESRASTRAWVGNFLVVGGLALGGYGGYLLYRDRKNRSATISPRPVETGTGVMLTVGGRL